MRLALLLVLGCSKSVPHEPARAPVPRDPALATLAGNVGPTLRGVARAELGAIVAELGDLDTVLPAFGVRKLSECHVTLARVRAVVGEPLRIAAELDGEIDVARLDCLLGGQLAALQTALEVTVTDRAGGIAVSRAPMRGTPPAALLDRCEGPSCLAVEVGPRGRELDVAFSFGETRRGRVGGPGFGDGAARIIAAVTELHDASLTSVTLRADGRDLVTEIRGRDPAWAAAFKEHLAEAFRIPSSSMRPTLVEGDNIFVAKGALAGPIVPGDVIVHRGERGTYIKRVIATGGQTVTETETGLAIDGVPLRTEVIGDYAFDEEGHAQRGKLVREHLGARSYVTLRTGPPHQPGTWTVPPGQLFLVGDNRNNSNDSRYNGAIATTEVVGRVAAIWLAQHDGVPDWDRMGQPIE